MPPNSSFQPSASNSNAPAQGSKAPLWVALASVLVWAIAPVALVWGVILRGKAARSGRPEPHAQKLVVLGGIGTILLVGSSIWEAISKEEAPSAQQTANAAQVAPSSTPSASVKEETVKAEAERAAVALKTAKELLADKASFQTELKSTVASTAAGKLMPAREKLDALKLRFGDLERSDFIPGEKDPADVADVLRGADALFAGYTAADAALTAKELAVVDAAIRVLRDPKNSAIEPPQLFAQAGKQFGLSGRDMQVIYTLHPEETQERIDAFDKALRSGLEAKCGAKPQESSNLSGGLRVVETYVKKTAHDPDSVEVENCTEPTLSEKSCWVTTCDVRGENAFGAKVQQHARFSITKGAAAPL